MCPVQWGSSPRRFEPRLPWANCPPLRTVCLLGSPDTHVTIMLHWLGKGQNSKPCMGVDCVHCIETAEPYCYAGGLMWDYNNRKFIKAIVPLGHPSGRLAQDDLAGKVIDIEREEPRNPNSRLVMRPTRQWADKYVPGPLPSFDVRPFILRRWGLFDEAALIGCEFHLPQPALELTSTPDA